MREKEERERERTTETKTEHPQRFFQIFYVFFFYNSCTAYFIHFKGKR